MRLSARGRAGILRAFATRTRTPALPSSFIPPTTSLQRRLQAALLAATLAACGSAAGADWALQVRSERHSDFSSIDDLRDDNAAGYRARHARNLAYVEEEVRLQRSEGLWSLALLGRSSATLVANEDAVNAVRHVRGIGRDAADRQWDVEARMRGFAGVGAELGRAFQAGPEWSGAVLVQALALTRWREREVNGVADFQSATGTYAFDLRSRELNDRLSFPFQQSSAAAGAALLFGADLAWQRGAWRAHAGVRDLGWLHWRGLPQQDLTASSSTRAVDAEGFVVYRPLLQGQNRQGGLTRRAPYRLQLDASWQATEHGSLEVAARKFEGYAFLPSIGWKQGWGKLQAAAHWQLHERRLVLDVGWENWHAFLGTDKLGSGAQSRAFGLRYQRAF